MVRASVTFNKEKHTYECKVLDKNNLSVFEITTPGNRLCIVRNYQQKPELKHEDNDLSKPILGAMHWFPDPAYSSTIQQYINECPLIAYFWTNFYEVYHPIKNEKVSTHKFNNSIGYDFFGMLLHSIWIDILNHVLEFDRQRKKDELLEHSQLRTQFQSDMIGVASEITQDKKENM